MKGIAGLSVAVTLGVAAAVLNFVYLSHKGREVEKVAFVGIADGVVVQPGDAFAEHHLVPVEIPRSGVRELQHFAVLYADRHTIIGMPATRTFTGGELVLRQDLRAPPPELALKSSNERAMWIPVDTKTFVPSLVVPGDTVSFLVSTAPSFAVQAEETDDGAPPATVSVAGGGGKTELIGPFRVLSIGNRLGSPEVHRSAGMPQMQENVLAISVREEGGDLEPKARRLWTLLQQTGFRQVGVLLHPRGGD
jgi:Flp pilus assembly protein CpaB